MVLSRKGVGPADEELSVGCCQMVESSGLCRVCSGSGMGMGIGGGDGDQSTSAT